MSYCDEQFPLSWSPGGCVIFTVLTWGQGSELPLTRGVRSIGMKKLK